MLALYPGETHCVPDSRGKTLSKSFSLRQIPTLVSRAHPRGTLSILGIKNSLNGQETCGDSIPTQLRFVIVNYFRLAQSFAFHVDCMRDREFVPPFLLRFYSYSIRFFRHDRCLGTIATTLNR